MATSYTFTAIDDPNSGNGPGGGTRPLTVNDQGQVAGYYVGTDGQTRGFLDSNGTFTDTSVPNPALPSVSVPGAASTTVEGVNSLGQIVGWYYTSGSSTTHGFVDTNGSFTSFDVPVPFVEGTFANGINDKGQVVGLYFDDNGIRHGFVDTNGAFALIDDPSADSRSGTEVTGINNAGEIIGQYTTSDDVTHGFSATPPANAPRSQISGSPGRQLTSDESSLTPFSGLPDLGLGFGSGGGQTAVTIVDPTPGATELFTITETDQFGATGDVNGRLTGAGLTESSSQPGVYILAVADPATVSKELDALVFTPTPHEVAPGSSVITNFSIVDTNSADPTEVAIDTTTSAIVVALDDAPIIEFTQAGQQVNNNAATHPFANVGIIELDHGVQDSATIILSGAGGTLSGAGLSATGTAGTYSLAAASSTTLESEVDALIFTPAAGLPGTSGTTTFALTVSQTGAGNRSTNDSTTTVTNTVVAQPSTISGAKANQATTDEASIKPFANVKLADPNLGGTDSLVISANNGSVNTYVDGTLSGAGLTQGLFTGAYVLSGNDPVTLTQELDALVFTPTARQVAPGQQVTTTFTLSDANSVHQTVTNNTTSVVTTAVNDAPTISGAKAGQSTTNFASIKPFAGVSITDPDLGAQVSLTIAVAGQFGGAGGMLAGTGLSHTFIAGVYSLAAASPAALSSELDQLTFSPASAAPNTLSATSFSLTASQTAGGSTAATIDSTTTVVNTVSPPLPSIIQGTQNGQAITDASAIKPFARVTITDPNGPYATDNVEIVLENASSAATDANGTLSGAGLTKTGAGVYTLSSAGASAITTELDNLVLTSSKDTSGSPVTTGFLLIDFNSVLTNGATTDSATSVVVSPVSGPILGGGAPSGSTVTIPAADTTRTTIGTAPIAPFAGATIADANRGSPTETVTVTPSTTGIGALADPSASSDGSTMGSNGSITLHGSAGQVTTELDALTFTPAFGQSGRVTFTISDLNSVVSFPASATASLTVNLPPAPTPVQLRQIGTTLVQFLSDSISHRSTVADTSALVGALTTLDVSQPELGQLLDQALTTSKLASVAASTLATDLAALWYPKITADLSHAGQGLATDLTGLVATGTGAALDDLFRVGIGQGASAALTATLHDFRLA